MEDIPHKEEGTAPAGASAQTATPQKMTDQDATPFDWWLLDYLRDQLFGPAGSAALRHPIPSPGVETTTQEPVSPAGGDLPLEEHPEPRRPKKKPRK